MAKKPHDEQKQILEAEYYAASAHFQVASDREADKQILIGSGFGIGVLISLLDNLATQDHSFIHWAWIAGILFFVLAVVVTLVIFKNDGELLRIEMNRLESDPDNEDLQDNLYNQMKKILDKNKSRSTWMHAAFVLGILSALISLIGIIFQV